MLKKKISELSIDDLKLLGNRKKRNFTRLGSNSPLVTICLTLWFMDPTALED